MLTPSKQIIHLLSAFKSQMTAPTFRNACLLIYGSILAPGKRTITAALRVLGIKDPAFCKYHRVLSRNQWSPLNMSRILLGLLVQTFVSSDQPLLVPVDETLERRQGKRIAYKGWFRDAVRSIGGKVAVSLGIRWLCGTLLVKVHWSKRPWALPFYAIPVLSEKTCKKLKKTHRTACWWTAHLAETLREWYPKRTIHLIGDGGFASIELITACQSLKVNLVSRLRLNARLYDFPSARPQGKRGPDAHKGNVQRKLSMRAADPKTIWCCAEVPWYGGQTKAVFYVTGVSLWYTPGQMPVPIRWVLLRYEEVHPKTKKSTWKYGALFCSDTEAAITPEQIIGWYTDRWNIEVTFEEMRAHMGFETQRNWSRRSIERTTPCLFGLFSLVVLMANILYPEKIPIQQTAWYKKDEATFSDVLASVRSHLWDSMNYVKSPKKDEMRLIPDEDWRRLQQLLCYAA